jgi:hypothetical protein
MQVWQLDLVSCGEACKKRCLILRIKDDAIYQIKELIFSWCYNTQS